MNKITMKCFIHNGLYLSHEGCKQCDYKCNCGLKFMTVDDLRRHVDDNHPGHMIISADIAVNVELGDEYKTKISWI